MRDYVVKDDGTFAVNFRCPKSPNAEQVFGQNAIRLNAALKHYRLHLVNILVKYSLTGVVPAGRHLGETVSNGHKMLALTMNQLDVRPYIVDRLTAQKIAYTISNNGVDHTIDLLDKCRQAVYQPVYLHRRRSTRTFAESR